MKKFTKTLFSTLFLSSLVLSTSYSFAKDNDSFSRYHAAKIKITYEGEVGDLLQAVSNRLGVAYLTYKTDFSKKININNQQPINIQTLFAEIKKQVPNMEIGFEKIGETITLVTNDVKSPLKLKNEQFIGEVIFGENNPSNESDKVEISPSTGNQLEVILPTEDKTVDTEAQKKTLNNEESAILTTTTSDSPEAKALNELVSKTTDEAIIAKYKKKKAPKYKIAKDELQGLAAVKVTNIGTFLIFKNTIDTAKLKVKGKFEAIAQYGNIIAISHQKWVSPKRIEIVNEDNQILILEKVGK